MFYKQKFTVFFKYNFEYPPLPQYILKYSVFFIIFQSCQLLKSGATRVFHEHCKVPYMYKGKTWISYDDEQSIQIKVTFPAKTKKSNI